MPITLDAEIEALLFWKGEPTKKRDLARAFGVNLVAINDAIKVLAEKLDGRGVALLLSDAEVELRTAPEAAALIEKFRREELAGELGRAAFETLAVILYKDGATRRELEYIRGVNSVSILRTLLVRGLITRSGEEGDERVFRYRPTLELLALLGMRSAKELPEYQTVVSELAKIQDEKQNTSSA